MAPAPGAVAEAGGGVTSLKLSPLLPLPELSIRKGLRSMAEDFFRCQCMALLIIIN